MNDISIDDLPESQPYQFPKPLAELYPDEIRFFQSRFIWWSNRSGFYPRTGYEKKKGWHARKRLGVEWMPLYPASWSPNLEKHLDFDRFCLNADWMSPNRPKDDETAFWLGTMAGKYTYYDCIATTCDWMAVCAGLLEPIVKQMHRQILPSRVIQTDDTPVTVLDKVKGRTGPALIHLGIATFPRGLRLHHRSQRGRPGADAKGYRGYLQADAYSAYDRLYANGTIVEVGGWIRAAEVFEADQRSAAVASGVGLDPGLYAVEREAKTKELDDAQRLTLRRRSRGRSRRHQGVAGQGGGAGVAQESDGRGDRLRVEPLEGPGAVPGGGFPGDRQRARASAGSAGGGGPEQLIIAWAARPAAERRRS